MGLNTTIRGDGSPCMCARCTIKNDYYEACKIKDLSPKASATLARRCIQGMIRDFWKIKKRRLVDEINALKSKVEYLTWKAIDTVRNVGNIGAHMEKDIDLIIDVDPDEAKLLIHLIEKLIEQWYVKRHDDEEALNSIIDMGKEKEAKKKEKLDASIKVEESGSE